MKAIVVIMLSVVFSPLTQLQLVCANDSLRIQEGNRIVLLSVSARPSVLRWNSSTEDALFTCEADVQGSGSVGFLNPTWSPPVGLQRADYDDRWEETNFTNWQEQRLTKMVILRLRNAVPEDAGYYNCTVTYNPNVVSSSYRVWTTAQLEVDESQPGTGGILPLLYGAAGVASLVLVFFCASACWIYKKKSVSRVQIGPAKGRSQSGSSVKRIYSKERDHFGGRLLDDDKRMQIDRRGGDLCVKMNNIARGWKAADISDEDQRLEVRQLLDDPNDIDACCTVRLEKLNPQASISSVWSTISIWQEETHGPTVILKPSDALQMSPTFDASRDTLSPTQTFLHQQDELRPSNRPFPIVPLEVRHEMCVLLDVEDPQGKDWRMLAEKLQINPPTIRWIGRDKSPTNKVLSFWETQNPSGGIVAVQRLCDMCEDIGRPDVKELVEKVLSSGGQGDSGYADSASVSTMSRDASSESLATLSQSVASESFSETPRAIGLLNSMQVTDV